MHNNYYFFRLLTAALREKIIGYTIVSCFSQTKDELVIELNNASVSFFIKATLQPEFQCLSFPPNFHRARKNSIDLFPSLIMKKVSGVRQFTNERSLGLEVENGITLVFKMHGARANAVLFQDSLPNELFRNNFEADESLNLRDLDRSIDWGYENFINHINDLPSIYPTFGKRVWDYLNLNHIASLDADGKWKLIQETRSKLSESHFYIYAQQTGTYFSLLDSPDKLIASFTEPIEAINDFFITFTSTLAFHKEQSWLLKTLASRIKQTGAYIEKNIERRKELEHDSHFSQWADLIMANLNKINPRQEKITVENFYDDQRPVEIKLRKELNAQKNAEAYYQKSRNQAKEISRINESVILKEKEYNQLIDWQSRTIECTDLSGIRKISALVKKDTKDEAKPILPYHEFVFKDFQILVGKNAGANDQLTLKHSYKEDLWLHAKDVAGSHVLLKHKAGKPFPKDVIEYAAGLAAFYSKRKNEALCPVAITPKKFVRKRKGDPPGAVVVERENVILVEPVSGR